MGDIEDWVDDPGTWSYVQILVDTISNFDQKLFKCASCGSGMSQKTFSKLYEVENWTEQK